MKKIFTPTLILTLGLVLLFISYSSALSQSTWEKVNFDGWNIYSLNITEHGTMYVSAVGHGIYSSTDYSHWKKLELPNNDINNPYIYVCTDSLLIIGQSDTLYYSVDNGLSFDLLQLPGARVFGFSYGGYTGFELTGNGSLYAVDQSSLYSSTNIGKTWRTIPIPDRSDGCKRQIYQIRQWANDTILAFGYYKYCFQHPFVFLSADSGKTWVEDNWCNKYSKQMLFLPFKDFSDYIIYDYSIMQPTQPENKGHEVFTRYKNNDVSRGLDLNFTNDSLYATRLFYDNNYTPVIQLSNNNLYRLNTVDKYEWYWQKYDLPDDTIAINIYLFAPDGTLYGGSRNGLYKCKAGVLSVSDPDHNQENDIIFTNNIISTKSMLSPHLELYNYSGTKVAESYSNTLDISHLPPSIYFISVNGKPVKSIYKIY